MAAIRQLKLNLLADTTDFQQGIKRATGQTQTFESKVRETSRKVANAAKLMGAAAGVVAVKFGVDSVKAAMADEKGQRRLAKALQNTTKATSKQIQGVEKYITKTSLASGVVDDKLRPAFQRLVQATKDTTKAQNLMQLALDVSAGTGKDLETVANALGKAYGGNLASLQRLGIGLDQSIIKSKDTNAAFKVLSKTFAGQSSASANSLEGKFARLGIALDETKESIGVALLPVAEKLSTWMNETGVPAIQGFVAALSGQDQNSFVSAGTKAGDTAYNVGRKIKDGLKYIIDHKDDFAAFAMAWATWWATTKAIAGASAILNTLKLIRGAMVTTTAVSATTAAATSAATGGASLAAALPAIAAIAAYFGIQAFNWKPKGSDPSQWVENQDPNSFNGPTRFGTPRQSVVRNGQTWYKDPSSGRWYTESMGNNGTTLTWRDHPPATTTTGTMGLPPGGYQPPANSPFQPRNIRSTTDAPVVINLNGIVDAESARRSIEQLLQQSALRTGAVSLTGYAI